jgi:hypothetical protein
MPSPGGRLDTVEIPHSGGVVSIPWESREELVARLKNGGNAASAVKAFEAVGASVPVTLTTIDKLAVVEAIDAWVKTVDGPMTSGLPDGIVPLYRALVEDLR